MNNNKINDCIIEDENKNNIEKENINSNIKNDNLNNNIENDNFNNNNDDNSNNNSIEGHNSFEENNDEFSNNNDNNENNNKKNDYDNIYFIDTYYDKSNNFTYIISCCSQYVKSFNYNLNILYQKYQDNEIKTGIHSSAIINETKNKVQLIESAIDGFIRIWDFHESILLKRIKICEEGIKGICLWDENLLCVGCDDKSIKIVKLNDGNIVRIIFGHKAKVCTIKEVNHEKFGKCLISKGWGSDTIKLWYNNEIN